MSFKKVFYLFWPLLTYLMWPVYYRIRFGWTIDFWALCEMWTVEFVKGMFPAPPELWPSLPGLILILAVIALTLWRWYSRPGWISGASVLALFAFLFAPHGGGEILSFMQGDPHYMDWGRQGIRMLKLLTYALPALTLVLLDVLKERQSRPGSTKQS